MYSFAPDFKQIPTFGTLSTDAEKQLVLAMRIDVP